ncbi:microtubule-associated protein futsch-like [Argopecten irradians]|uniref:microtubule-associated protein futsch-like n=1 Tax=Argopecten irradians TaxID=31199 RepID=UPI003711B45F
MDTEASAMSNEDVINEPRQHQGENYILHPSDANADNCGECSKNSANLTENSSLLGNDTSKVSVFGEEDSKNSASLSVEDSFELVVNLPNTIDTTKSPAKTSTPKPKQAVHKSRVSSSGSRSEEASSLQTSAAPGNVQTGGSLEGNLEGALAISGPIKQLGPTDLVSQKDASIQTSPLVSLVKETYAPEQRKLSSAGPVEYEEENPLARINAGQETIEAQGPCKSQTSDLSSIQKTTNTSGLETNFCLHEKFKVPEISDFDRHVQMDQEVESCTSQSTDSAECPTEIIINNPDQDLNYKDMFEDSDMDDGVFDEDDTKEVYMDTCDIDKVGTEAADRTEIVSEGDIDPAGDLNKTLNKTVELLDEVTNDVQLDKTESVSENDVCGMELDSAEQTGCSDTLGQFENSKDIEGDVSLVKETEAQDNISEIKENNPIAVVSKETGLSKSDFMESGMPIINQEKDTSEENVKIKHDYSHMDREVTLLVPELAYTKDHEAKTQAVQHDSPNSNQEINEVEKPKPSEIGVNSGSADIGLESHLGENDAEESIDTVLSASIKSDLNNIVMNVNGSENNTVDDDSDAKEKDTNSATVTMHPNELNVTCTATKEADKLNSDFSSDSDLENIEPADVDINKNFTLKDVQRQKESTTRDVPLYPSSSEDMSCDSLISDTRVRADEVDGSVPNVVRSVVTVKNDVVKPRLDLTSTVSVTSDHEKSNDHNTMSLEQSTTHHHEGNSESKEQNEEAFTKEYPGETAGDNIQIGHCAGLEQGEDVVDNRTVESCKENLSSAILPNISLVSSDAHLCHQSDIDMDDGASLSLVMELEASADKQTMNSEPVQTSGATAEKMQEQCKDSVFNLNLEFSLDLQSEEKMDESERVALNQTQEDLSTYGNIEADVSEKSHKTKEKAREGTTTDLNMVMITEAVISEQVQEGTETKDNSEAEEVKKTDKDLEVNMDISEQEQTYTGGNDEELVSELEQEDRGMNETSVTEERPCEQTKVDKTNENGQPEEEISEQMQEGRDMHETSETGEGHSEQNCQAGEEIFQQVQESKEDVQVTPDSIQEDRETDENSEAEQIPEDIEIDENGHVEEVLSKHVQEHNEAETGSSVLFEQIQDDKATYTSKMTITACINVADQDKVLPINVIPEGKGMTLISPDQIKGDFPPPDTNTVADVEVQEQMHEGIDDDRNSELQSESEKTAEHILEGPTTEKTPVDDLKGLASTEQVSNVSSPKVETIKAEAESIAWEHVQESTETDGIIKDEPDAAISMEKTQVTLDGLDPICEDSSPTGEMMETEAEDVSLENLAETSFIDRKNELRTNITTPDEQFPKVCPSTKEIMETDGTSSSQTLVDITSTEGNIEDGSPSDRSNEAETDGNDVTEDKQQGSLAETEAITTIDTDYIQVQESSASERTKFTDEGPEKCIATESDCVGSSSPISRKIQALQDFCQSISPLTKATENNNNIEVFMSPATKRRKDRADASDMISCLEDSISSIDNASDIEGVSVSLHEVKDMPPVFVVDMDTLDKKDCNGNTNVSRKLDMADEQKEGRKDVQSNISICRVVGNEAKSPDIKLTKTPVRIQEENSNHCQSPKENFPQNCFTLILEGSSSSNTTSTKDQETGVQNIDVNVNCIPCKGETLETCTEKAAVDEKPVQNIDLMVENDRETIEGCSVDSTPESSMDFSSMSLTDSCTSRFSESNLVTVWEIDNRNLSNANSVEETGDELLLTNSQVADSTQVAESIPDECSPALQSTDSTQVTELTTDECSDALESTDSTQVAESTPDECSDALQSTDSTQVAESTPDECSPALQSTDSTQVTESTPDECSDALESTDSTQVAESTPDECSDALESTDSTQVTELTPDECSDALESTDSTQVAESTPDECSDALQSTDSTQVVESTPGECSSALESTDSTQVTESTPVECSDALQSTDSTQVAESTPGECCPALESTDSTQVSESTPDEHHHDHEPTNATQVAESTPDEHHHDHEPTNATQVAESTPDECSPALVLTDSTQVAESKETHCSQITEATKLNTEKTPGIEATNLNNEHTPCARSIDTMETETRDTSCHSDSNELNSKWTPCSAHHETTKHVTQTKIKDSPENSLESVQQLENSGDSHDTVSCNILKGKRKRKMSNEISEDEQHVERKKRKTWYQNVKNTVTNFFNIKDKVSSKKRSCSNKQLRKENISKMVKRFFFLKGKQTRSVHTSQERGKMESEGETVASHSVVLAELSQQTGSHGMDTTLTKSLDETVPHTMDTALTKSSDEAVSHSLDTILNESSDEAVSHSLDTILNESSDEAVSHYLDTILNESSDEAVSHSLDTILNESSDEAVSHSLDTILTESSEQTDTYSLDNVPTESSEQMLTISTDKVLTDSSEKTTTQTVAEMKAGSSLQTEHSSPDHGPIPVDSYSNEHVHSSVGEHKVSGSLQTSDTTMEVSSNTCDNKDGSHGDKDVNLSDDCNISGESQGFDPCLDCHEDTPESETKDEVLQLCKEFPVTTSENNEDIQSAEEECTQADSLEIGNENVLNKSQDSRDFLDQNLDSSGDRLLDDTDFTESTDTQNSESLLGPLETLVCSLNKKAAEYTEFANTQNSESLLGPFETLVCSSNKKAAEYTESANTQNCESLFGPLETLVCSSNKEAANTDKEQDSQSDSDSMLASKESKEILRPESNGEEDLLNLPSEEESSSTDHYWTVPTEPTESMEKTVVSEEMEDKSKDSRDVSGKSLLSSIPVLDLKGRTYSMSDLDSSDISIITLRSSEELDCWEGNDINGDVLKQKNTQEKDIPSENIIHLKQELEGFQTPTVGSLKDTNESEQNTELTDVSSVNYCPLPDFESDSWIDESTSALDISAKYISPCKNEIVISDSSDSLPEVVFLREEKTNRNFKTEYPDGEILSVKQEFVPLADDSSVSSTESKNMEVKTIPQSPLTTLKSRPILRRRGLNSPRSDISTSTPLSCCDDETDGRKDLPRKRRKKKSPIKNKNKTPEKKQTTPRTTPKFKRRPLRKKNKSEKCCAEEIIELITDSESDDDDPSKFISPPNSVQKGRDKLKQGGTKSVTLNASRGSCKGNDLQGDLLQDIQDEDVEMDEKVQTTESGGEASIQDIFNSEEFGEDSSLPASFSNNSLRSDIVLATATEETSTNIEDTTVVNSTVEKDYWNSDDGNENSIMEEEEENSDDGNENSVTEEEENSVDSDDYCTDDKVPEISEVDETVIPEDPAYASDEFSCQGDQDCLEESVGDDDGDDDEDDKDDESHVSDDNINSHIFPSSPPNHHHSDDYDMIPNTCDEDDDIDMPIPVLPPLSPWNQDEDVAPSQCLSPVFPDISKTFDTHTKMVERSRADNDSNMFDSEEDFSAPDVDWNAFENTTSDDKMDEESELSSRNDDIGTDTMGENGEDDRSPSEYLGQSDSGDLHNEETDGETITNTPRPTEASTSTNLKRRQLFNDEEVNNFPSPKRPRTKQLSIENFTQISPTSKLKRALDEDMLISTQCPLVSDINESQFEDASKRLLSAENATEGSAKKRKTREFLVNVKAKLMKYKKKKQSTPSQTESAPSSQETHGEMPVSSSVQRRILTEAEASNDKIAGYLSRCKDVISNLGQALEGRKLGTFPRVSQWRKDLSDIQAKTVLPRTTIAVVGDTGAGKSSLMNAVIDQLNTLPTSGMRACTAVVVEVLANTTSNNYEADIKFLSHQEWFDELQLLISDLTTADGKLKKHVPDLDSEAGVAFLKVKAVYGKVDTMAALKRLTAVTRMLDKVKTIKATNSKDFRRLIDRYIETADPGAGGQFWPIVKQVTIKMPNCDACSSGAVLVDLPGVRDSNAARDPIARDYLKNCTVVWVVAAIHRAINNKTAKEMLGENFRRQLLMDGQYGSVAFICTKSDDLMPSELIRNLRLDDECEALENEIESLIAEQNEANGTVGRMKKEIRKIGKEITELTDNIADMKETIEQMDGVIDLDSEEGEGMESVKELRLCLVDKEESLETIESEKADKEKEMDKATRESLELEKKIEVKRKEISAICAKARNEYSKSQIKRDFKAGLREMKRKAGLTNADEDDEMDDEDQDYISDDDDEEMGRTAENLRVFCVSSMEYQKMKNLLTNDGPPTVFSTTEDTQIPVLRRYIHELTSSRRQQHIDRLIRTLGQFVFDVQSYIMADGATCKGTRRDAKFAVEENSKELCEKFEPVLSRLTHDIEEIFCNSIETKMTDGVASAVSSANDTVSKWASTPNKEVRSEGGLHWKTYQCTVRRQGVYKSPTYGAIDFNEQLSEPMYRCISVCWDKVFSGLLWRTLENCRGLIMMTLATFVRDLCGKLQALEVDRSQTDRVSTQLCNSAKDKLAEMLTNLKELVLSRQRDISRVITPTVQENLDQTYTYCGGEAGKGMFMRIKQAMAGGVDYRRHNMFGEASRILLDSLIQLKEDVVSHVRLVCRSLCEMLQAAFEPLWEAPSQTKLLKDLLFDSVTQAVLSVSKLHTDANISLPVVPTRESTSNEDSPSLSGQSHQGSPVPQIDPALPGPSGLQMAKTAPVGPQMYTTTIGSTQRLVTDSHGKTKHVSVEMSKSTHVTDVLKHLKQEPGSTQVLSSTSIKKEWEPSSNFQEVSGPELNWLQRALPDLDSYDETQPSTGGRGKPSTLGRPSHVISLQVSSMVPQTARSELLPQNSSTVTRPQLLVPTRPGNSSQLSTVTRPHPVGLFGPELSPQNSSSMTRPQIAVPSRPGIPPPISCVARPQTAKTPGFLHTSTLPGRVVVSNNTVSSAAGLSRNLIQVDLNGKKFYSTSLGKVVTIPDKKCNTIDIGSVAGKTLLLPKSVLIPATASGSRVELSTPHGNPRTACNLPNPGVGRVIIPAVASGRIHQATNRPTVVRIEKPLSSPVSDSPAKQLVSIIDKNVISSSQTKQPSSQASILSKLCSHKGSAEASSSQTEQNSSPTLILSQLRSNKSSTGTNSPVTGMSNKGRSRLSLKKNSTQNSPLHSQVHIKQEPMEHNSAQQCRIRRANQNNYEVINLCDDSDNNS